jgi:hypothetical protein
LGGVLLQNLNIFIKKRKLTFKIVGIGQASNFLSHNLNAHNSIHEKGSYHRHLAEQERRRLYFDCYHICSLGEDERSGRTLSLIVEKSQSARSGAVL